MLYTGLNNTLISKKMFRYLHNLELKWWQAAIYEAAMISLGILIGARFYYYFVDWVVVFLILALAGGGYIGWLWWKQQKSAESQGKNPIS